MRNAYFDNRLTSMVDQQDGRTVDFQSGSDSDRYIFECYGQEYSLTKYHDKQSYELCIADSVIKHYESLNAFINDFLENDGFI